MEDKNIQNKILEELKKLTGEVSELRYDLKKHETRLSRLEGGLQPEKTGPLVKPPASFEGITVPPPPPPLYGEGPPSPFQPRGMFEDLTGAKLPQVVDWEQMLGGNWLMKVGIAAVVIGVGFFLKYAFEHWIDPTGQVIVGLLIGMALIGAGEYWKEKYGKYAQTLTGGGIAVLYLTFYGAHAFLKPPVIPSAYVTFFFMGLVTFVTGVLAIRYNAILITIFGMLGGYLSPLLLYKNLGENELILIGYIVLLNFGVMGISLFKNWRPLALASFIATHWLFLVWHGTAYKPEKLAFAEYALSLFFLQFVFVTIIYHLVNRKVAENPDITLMSANAAVYFGWSWLLLKEKYEIWLGSFAIILALFYFLLAYLAYLRNRDDPRLTLTLSGVSLVFLTIAVPIQLKQYWITMAWAAEGVVLTWLGFYLKSYHLRAFSLLVFLLVVGRLFGFDMAWDVKIEEFQPVFNKTFFVFAVSIASLYLAAWIWWIGKEDTRADEKYVMPTLLLVANFLTLWSLSYDLIRFFDKKIAVAKAKVEETVLGRTGPEEAYFQNLRFLQNLFVTLLWAIYALALMLVGVFKKYQIIQAAGLLLLAIVMVKFVGIDMFGQPNLTFAQNFSLSFIWLIYSIVLIGIGIILKYKPMRLAAIAFLWIIVLKVFVFDTWNLQQLYRIGSYISLGVILLVIGYLYTRFQERIKEFLLE